MLRSILTALDGTEHSEAAAELGLRWAKEHNARLCGIGVIDQPTQIGSTGEACESGVPNMEGHWKTEAQRVKALVEDFTDRCRRAGVAAGGVCEVGVPSERILLESQRHDLTIISRRFETPESTGDVFTQVLQSSPRPVVAVPDSIPDSDAIIVAYDGKLHSVRALQLLVATGLCHRKQVHVVSLASSLEAARRLTELAASFLSVHDIIAQRSPLVGDDAPAEALLAQIEELDAGLLVMGEHKRPVLKELFIGSATKTLLKESRVPLFLSN